MKKSHRKITKENNKEHEGTTIAKAYGAGLVFKFCPAVC